MYCPLIIRILIILLWFSFSQVFSKQTLVLECIITSELENDLSAKKKLYKENLLSLYVDKTNSWINDVSFTDWLDEYNEDLDKVLKEFFENNKKFVFNYLEFESPKKKKLQLSYNIIYEKFGNYLEFKKNYHDHNGDIFFISEVRGNCSEKSK